MQKPKTTKSGRLPSLDYLRGYFVVVVIVDHLWKYPSLWAAVSGEAKLWVTAAEGFVIISGFLIGYVRGFKNLDKPFTSVAGKLVSRALMLYFWMVIASLIYVWLEWSDKIPNMPYTLLPTEGLRSWPEMFGAVASGNPQVWVHFLLFYAIFLAMAVPAVWLLRHRQALAIIGISLILT